MDNFFSNREMEGRYEWFLIIAKDVLQGKRTIHYTEDPYEVYDFDMTAHTSATVLSYGEIKTVHRPYTKFDTFQIDYNKLKALQDLAKENGRVPYLVCFFDDWDVVWDVSDIDLEDRRYTTYCTSTTADYQKGKREKEEVWLSIAEDAAIYKRKKFN